MDKVKHGFEWMWLQYRNSAYGHDAIDPINGYSMDNWGGLKLFMLESLGTMHLMGLDKWYKSTEQYLEENLDFNINRGVNVFELTIRCLGSLASAYDTNPSTWL